MCKIQHPTDSTESCFRPPVLFLSQKLEVQYGMYLMICDDQKSELETMKQIVSEYAAVHSELSLEI